MLSFPFYLLSLSLFLAFPLHGSKTIVSIKPVFVHIKATYMGFSTYKPLWISFNSKGPCTVCESCYNNNDNKMKIKQSK